MRHHDIAVDDLVSRREVQGGALLRAEINVAGKENQPRPSLAVGTWIFRQRERAEGIRSQHLRKCGQCFRGAVGKRLSPASGAGEWLRLHTRAAPNEQT